MVEGELDQLKEEMLRLANAHEVECTNLQDCLEDLQHELHEKNIAIANAEEAIECYTKELTDQAEHSSEIVNQWKGMISARFIEPFFLVFSFNLPLQLQPGVMFWKALFMTSKMLSKGRLMKCIQSSLTVLNNWKLQMKLLVYGKRDVLS